MQLTKLLAVFVAARLGFENQLQVLQRLVPGRYVVRVHPRCAAIYASLSPRIAFRATGALNFTE
jgi:hypothetical protein